MTRAGSERQTADTRSNSLRQEQESRETHAPQASQVSERVASRALRDSLEPTPTTGPKRDFDSRLPFNTGSLRRMSSLSLPPASPPHLSPLSLIFYVNPVSTSSLVVSLSMSTPSARLSPPDPTVIVSSPTPHGALSNALPVLRVGPQIADRRAFELDEVVDEGGSHHRASHEATEHLRQHASRC